MSNITPQQIEHLAHLARLKLSPEQKDSLLGDMESILGLISQLDEVDVSGIETDGFPHIRHIAAPLEGVQGCKDAQHMMKNITHPLKDNAIVVKSAIKK